MAAPAARPTTEDRIRAALWFAERGFGIFTVWSTNSDGSCRCPKGRGCENAGKHPVTAHGFQDATTDPARITTLLSAGSEPNYGLVCPEGVFTLDVDGDGIARLAELEERLGPLPPTLRTRTANGEHVFLRWPSTLPRPIGQLWGFVTRWGSGQGAGYVVGPRSVHASGAVYAPSGVFEIAEIPEAWAHDVLAPQPAAEDAIEIHGGYELPAAGYRGSRYDAIRDFIASRYMRGVTREEILAGVLTVLAPRFADPLPEADLRSRFERAWKGTAERLGPPRTAQEPRKQVGPGIDAADLLEQDIAPLQWIVPGFLPEGTTILAAAPKIGKSCLVYQVAVEAAIGGELFGERVTPGSVLYLALEDGTRRGQSRLRSALAGRTMPRGRLEVRWDAREIGGGLEEDIATWLDGHPDAVLVALDTLGKVRPRSDGRRGAYEVDVKDLARLQDLFRNRRASLLIVHHTRKDARDDDFVTAVNGSYGISGSADTIITVRRKRLERFGKIVVTGRDIAEIELPVQFDDMLWSSAPTVVATGSSERAEVYRVIASRGPIMPKAIADELALEPSSVSHMIRKLHADGAVARVAAGWVIPVSPIVSDLPDHPDHSSTDSSDRGDTRARARAREAVWVSPCRSYAAHTNHHRNTTSGWTCDACYPEED